MKQVVLLIADRFQPDASGFVRAYEALGGNIDGVLVLSRQKGFLYHLRGVIKVLRALSPEKIKRATRSFLASALGMTSLEALKKSWGNSGGSEDLPSMDIIQHAKQLGVPISYSNQLTTQIISEVTGGKETLFPFYVGGILEPSLLSMKNVEFVNAHMGKMPRYRGMNVLEWAVYENQPPEVSVMIMNKSIDGGDVIHRHPIDIAGCYSIQSLRQSGFRQCYEAMAIAIDGYAKGVIQRQQQSSGATYYYRMHPIISQELEARLRAAAS